MYYPGFDVKEYVFTAKVRAMMRPPAGVRMVMEAVCIMQNVKPKKVAGEKLGTKVDDYWEPGKALLQDPGKVICGVILL